jgi:thiol-disulfide isomerase/thioredoxin
MILARRLLLPITILSIIMLLSFVAPAQSPKRGAARQKAPVQKISVQEIDAEALKGLLKREPARPIVINFWATWCDPCRDEFPDLVKMDKDYRPQGIDFAAVSLDDLADIKTAVPKFLRRMGATMPAYLLNVTDPELAINGVDPTWSGALPATFLYNAQGELVFKHFGRIKPLELRAEIEKLVGTRAVMSDK